MLERVGGCWRTLHTPSVGPSTFSRTLTRRSDSSSSVCGSTKAHYCTQKIRKDLKRGRQHSQRTERSLKLRSVNSHYLQQPLTHLFSHGFREILAGNLADLLVAVETRRICKLKVFITKTQHASTVTVKE